MVALKRNPKVLYESKKNIKHKIIYHENYKQKLDLPIYNNNGITMSCRFLQERRR